MRFSIVAAVLTFAGPAFAQAPQIKIDFTQKLIGINGKPLTQPDVACKPGEIAGKDCPVADVTLSDAAIGGLETSIDEDRGLDPAKKFARDVLARKVYNNKAAELSAEDLATIKDRIGKVYGPNTVGAAWRLLDATAGK